MRYERRWTMVTTNLAFSEWVQVFGDETLMTALLDDRDLTKEQATRIRDMIDQAELRKTREKGNP